MLKGRAPTKAEQLHMSKVAALGCVCCRLDKGIESPAIIHHCKGKTIPNAHFYVLPLCYLHHTSGADCDKYTSRHPHKARFEQRYGTEQHLIEWVANQIGAAYDN